jgi:hypothetical protein
MPPVFSMQYIERPLKELCGGSSERPEIPAIISMKEFDTESVKKKTQSRTKVLD